MAESHINVVIVGKLKDDFNNEILKRYKKCTLNVDVSESELQFADSLSLTLKLTRRMSTERAEEYDKTQ